MLLIPTPPIFTGKSKTQTVRSLYIILWTLLLGLTFFGVLFIVLHPENFWRTSGVIFGIDVPCIILLVLTRRGATRLAGTSIIVILWIIVTLAVLTAGGIHAPSITVYMVIVLVAGLLFGPRSAFIVTALCSLTILAMVFLGASGRLPPAAINTPLTIWVLQTLYLFIVVGIYYLATNTINAAVLELTSREKYLTLLNQMTQAILAKESLDTVLPVLSQSIVELFDAADWYIVRWDAARQMILPFARSAKSAQTSAEVIPSAETQLTEAVLAAGHSLAVADLPHSEYWDPRTAGDEPASSAIAVPLLVGGQKLGVFTMLFDRPHEFREEEIRRAEQAGAQIALAFWNAQQDAEIAHQLKETDTLVKIGSALSASEHTGTSSILQLIVNSARELIPNAENSIIHILDAEEAVLLPEAISGYSKTDKRRTPLKMPLGKGVAGQVIKRGVTINIADVHTDPRFLNSETKPAYHSMLVAPIESRKQRIGTITVLSRRVSAFSPNEVSLIRALGTQAAIAIENTRLFETTQRRLKEIGVLYRISRGMAISLDVDYLFKEVVELLGRNFDYYSTQIFVLKATTGEIIPRHSSGKNFEKLQKIEGLHSGVGIVGHVAQTGEPFMTNNVHQVPFFKPSKFLPDTQSELAVPVKVEEQVVGILDIQQIAPHRLNDSDLQLMTAIADQLAVIMQEANLYSNLQNSLSQEQATRSQLLQNERLALAGRLLASVSHELNNPLQAIHNALFLIKDEISLSNQGRQDMDIILAETERMGTLIERLRLLYKPIREKDFQPLQLNDLVEDIYILISTHLRHKEISFEFHPDPKLPLIPGIPDQLKQVLLNLFLNAVEAMPPKGRLIVQTELLADRDEVMIRVKDTGPGIDPRLLPNIFDAFVTDKETGTGLGLTISHDIIEQHAGRIEASNHPEGGAIFTIWLPAEKRDFA
jgi:signal transduction histidine kinase